MIYANRQNIVQCSQCRATVIYEELESHICFTKLLVAFRVDTHDGKFFAFDGRTWYRWFPPTKPNNQKNQPDSEHYQHFGRLVLTYLPRMSVSMFTTSPLRLKPSVVTLRV